MRMVGGKRLLDTQGTMHVAVDIDVSGTADTRGGLPAMALATVSGPGDLEFRSVFLESGRQGDPPGTFQAVQTFQFGSPFALSTRAGVGAGWESVTTPINGAAQARISVRWLGINEVNDQNGATISAYTITSASGTDWRQPVAGP